MPAKTGAPELKGTRWQRLRLLVLATETDCGICHQWVDQALKWPHPMSPCVDHIVPRSKGGDPYDRRNCRLAHLTCNASRGNRTHLDRRPPPSRRWFG